MTEKAEWISAKKALTEISSFAGGTVAAKALLADLLRDGILHSRAKFVVRIDAPNTNAAWRQFGAEYDKATVAARDEYEEISPSVWRASKRWRADQEEWRWPANGFSVTRRLKPRQKTLIKSIEFAVSDLEKITATTVSVPSPQRRGGPKRQADRWRAFWHEIVHLAKADELDTDHFTTQADLVKHIAEKMAEKGVNEMNTTDAKKEVGELWRVFISRN